MNVCLHRSRVYTRLYRCRRGHAPLPPPHRFSPYSHSVRLRFSFGGRGLVGELPWPKCPVRPWDENRAGIGAIGFMGLTKFTACDADKVCFTYPKICPHGGGGGTCLFLEINESFAGKKTGTNGQPSMYDRYLSGLLRKRNKIGVPTFP